MPKQLRDARLTQRSLVLSQHNGLVFRGTVTTATDSTHFKISGLPAYGSASDFPDDFFKDYNAYVVWDAGGLGAAPQGEECAITGYTSADGTITHAAFTALLAVDDEILLIHPSIAGGTLLADLEEIKGVGFTTADDSLDAISTEIDEILDLTRSGGDIAVTSIETTLYIDDTPAKILVGGSIKIDTTDMATGDIYEFKEYYRMESAGSYIETSGGIVLSGNQPNDLHVIKLETYRYGIKITATKLAGTDRSFPIEVLREA